MNRSKTYIDCGAGVAGDMLLGALIGLGLDPRELQAALKPVIPLKGWSLRVKAVERRMWPAWTLKVRRDRPFTNPYHMLDALGRAAIPDPVKSRAVRILQALQRAEREAHGHDHGRFDPQGLGRIDTLVDVVGSSWGFWKLGIQDVYASAVNTGRIAPASARLISRYKIPIFSDSAVHELATPTGVAILTQTVRKFGPMRTMTLKKTGYGAGSLERLGKPNVLSIYQGKSSRKLLK